MDVENRETRLAPSRGGAQRPSRFVFSAAFRQTANRSYAWEPPTDVYEREDAIMVRVEVAGMAEAEFRISFERPFLLIQGARADSSEPRAYHQMEIRFGEFVSVVEVNQPVEVDAIEAEYEDGFLRVVLPKLLPKKIEVGE